MNERRAGVSVARVNTVGMSDVIKALQDRSGSTRERVEKALTEAAEIIAIATQDAARAHGLKDTNSMIDSIAPGPVRIFSDSAEVDVWPQGTRETRRGRKTNAVVGFVQHYGRTYKRTRKGGETVRKGTYFFDEAARDAADLAMDMIDEIWNGTK